MTRVSECPSGRYLWPFLRCSIFRSEKQVPRYKVTGEANITIKDIEYAPGESFEAAPKDVKWLVDDGYISPAGKTAPQSEPEPEPEAEEESGDDE